MCELLKLDTEKRNYLPILDEDQCIMLIIIHPKKWLGTKVSDNEYC